jgi:hypothetical protein
MFSELNKYIELCFRAPGIYFREGKITRSRRLLGIRMAKPSSIMKVAGLSFVGFCAVSLAADKASLAPALSQVAGFCGAFAGALVGRGRKSHRRIVEPEEPEMKAEEIKKS